MSKYPAWLLDYIHTIIFPKGRHDAWKMIHRPKDSNLSLATRKDDELHGKSRELRRQKTP